MQTKIKGLGEIAFRVNDLGRMQEFYQNIIGLQLMRRSKDAVFFRIADGFDGHTQILALFDRSSKPSYVGPSPEKSTIDHIAFEISLRDLESEQKRLADLGLSVTTAEHAWCHWRSIYVLDPEGNEVELVCYDEKVT